MKAGIKSQHNKAEMEEKMKKSQLDDHVSETDIEHYILKIETSSDYRFDILLSKWKRNQCRRKGSLRVAKGRVKGAINSLWARTLASQVISLRVLGRS